MTVTRVLSKFQAPLAMFPAFIRGILGVRYYGHNNHLHKANGMGPA